MITLSPLLINWERESHAASPEARVALQHNDPTAEWMVINYERLGEFAVQAERYSVMIIDEAHRWKEPTVEWTRHEFDIAAKVTAVALFYVKREPTVPLLAVD